MIALPISDSSMNKALERSGFFFFINRIFAEIHINMLNKMDKQPVQQQHPEHNQQERASFNRRGYQQAAVIR